MGEVEKAKRNAAKEALKDVEEGMCIGLGSGTTVAHFIDLLGEKDLDVACIPTSFDSRMKARENDLLVTETDAIEGIDLAVDGADKVTSNAILKGDGGALTREKIIDYNADKFLVIVDPRKIGSQPLSGVVNLEVLSFAAPLVKRRLADYNPKIRQAENKLGPVISDNGSFILDFDMEIEDPKTVEQKLNNIPGVIENGIFTKFDRIIVGTEQGNYDLS